MSVFQRTMLLLFYNTLVRLSGVIRCRRVHAHDFMRDVHRGIHKAKKLAPARDMSRYDQPAGSFALTSSRSQTSPTPWTEVQWTVSGAYSGVTHNDIVIVCVCR